MGQLHRLEIDISDTDDGYTATVTSDPVKCRPGHDIKWKVREPAGFPRDGVVFLQFFERIDGQKVYSSGCLDGGSASNGKHKGKKNGASNHRVDGHVGLTKQGPFLYEIYYSDSEGSHLLLDPEIIVEGSPDPSPEDDKSPKGGKSKGVAKKRGKTAKKKSAKRQAAKKGGKTQAAKRRKAAKRSTKAKKKTAKRRAAKKR